VLATTGRRLSGNPVMPTLMLFKIPRIVPPRFNRFSLEFIGTLKRKNPRLARVSGTFWNSSESLKMGRRGFISLINRLID